MSNSITTVNPTTGETLETYTLMDESQAKRGSGSLRRHL